MGPHGRFIRSALNQAVHRIVFCVKLAKAAMDGGDRTRRKSAWKPLVVVFVSLALLYLAAGQRPALPWAALAGSAAVLWFGRRWLTASLPARIAGVYLGFATAFLAVLRGFGFSADFWWVALPAVFLAIVALLYDLFVWQPHKGRFARARAERRGWPEQE